MVSMTHEILRIENLEKQSSQPLKSFEGWKICYSSALTKEGEFAVEFLQNQDQIIIAPLAICQRIFICHHVYGGCQSICTCVLRVCRVSFGPSFPLFFRPLPRSIVCLLSQAHSPPAMSFNLSRLLPARGVLAIFLSHRQRPLTREPSLLTAGSAWRRREHLPVQILVSFLVEMNRTSAKVTKSSKRECERNNRHVSWSILKEPLKIGVISKCDRMVISCTDTRQVRILCTIYQMAVSTCVGW